MTDNIGTRYVPDEGPEDAAVVFVGEGPGADEEKEGRPFIGPSGNKLETCLGRNGFSREEVRLANLFHYRPPGNDFTKIPGDRLAEGVGELKFYLESHRPNVVCTLGNWPLYFLTGKHGKRPGSGILNWRGSILESTLVPGLKVIPTVHPAAVLRDSSLYPTFDLDIKRVKEESVFSEIKLTNREYVVIRPTDTTEIEIWKDKLLTATELAVDIETFGPRLACVGFAPTPELGVCFIWDDTSFTVREAITTLLASDIPKNLQFGTFDTEFLYHQYGIGVNNYSWDTMIAQHIMVPELPRSLKYLTSIYTNMPYYKDEAKEDASSDKKNWGPKIDRSKLWIYNCKDCCVTREIAEKQKVEIAEGPSQWKELLEFEMKLARNVAPAISRAGMLVDLERRKLLDAALSYELEERKQGLMIATGAHVNVNSPKQVQQLLYWNFKLPERRNKTGRRTADGDALISLLQLCTEKMHEVKREATKEEWMKKALAIKLILLTRQTRKVLSSYVRASISTDGRYRSTYKVAATETGRWAAEKYVDGTGFNAQTTPRDSLEIEDELYDKLVKGEDITFAPDEPEEEDGESEED